MTKVAASSWFEELFGEARRMARNLDQEDLVRYTNMAADALAKFEELNRRNVPK